MPTVPTSARRIRLCPVATIAPPRHLPQMIEAREIGATIISRRKPNSRSQTSEMPAKAAVNSTDVASTPGYRNVRKLVPPPVSTMLPRPVPITKMNSTGCSSIVTMRALSCLRRSSSRRVTTQVARSWWDMSLRTSGSRSTGSRSGRVVVSRDVMSAPPGERGQALLRPLGVTDGATGVGHEDVVEARPGDRDRLDVDAELGEQPRDDLRALADGDGHLPLVHAGLDAQPLTDAGDGELVVVRAQGDPVGADAGLERLRGVLDGDLPVVHDRDPVAVLGLVHVVRGDEDGDLGALPQVVQVVPDGGPGLRVQADRGLVEEEHLRGVHQTAGDLQPALHA